MSPTDCDLDHRAIRAEPAGDRPLRAARPLSWSEQDDWTIAQLIQDDAIWLSHALPVARVYALWQHRLPMLCAVTVDILDLTETGEEMALGRVELVLPADMPATVLSAIRSARPRCVRCQRQCVLQYDAGRTTAPDTAVCEECDQP